MSRYRSPQYVDWGGRLVPRSLIEHLPVAGVCPTCGGLGEIPEQIDEDRWPVMVPCHQCRQYCKDCKKWVTQKSHSFGCPM